MKIGQKIILGFLLAILLVGIVGYFGIRTSNEIQKTFTLETKVSSLVSKVSEKGAVTFAATLTEDLEELIQLEEKANQLRDEIRDLDSALLKNPDIKNSVNFQSFLKTKNDHDKDQEQVFRIHKELLTRQDLFGESHLVEEAVRQRLRTPLLRTNDLELIIGFELMKSHSKEALFQYQDGEHVNEWLESIRRLRNDVKRKAGQERILLNQLTVYLETAEIVGEIVIRESEIKVEEARIVSVMRKREVELAELRRNIVDELLINTSRSSQNSKNALIVTIMATLALAVGVGLFISRSISTPIKRLTQTARDIAAGDLKKRVTVSTRDEIGQLATSFNEMADRLAAHRLELEKEVKIRTEELQNLLRENYNSAKLLVRRDLELSRANERLQELDVIKSEFVSIAAHQLRTPLSGIKWSLHSLIAGDEGKLNERQYKVTDGAAKATDRLIYIVNDLLDVARLEERRYALNTQKQSIVHVIKKVINHFQEAVKDKGIEVSFRVSAAKIPQLDFDEEKMIMVLDNFIDNAIKYTLPGGKVTIEASVKDRNVIVSVKDTGIGIPREQQHRVFSKFFRGRNAQLYQTTGTGLGLSMAKEIIGLHGGTISFISKEDKGSTFYFSLPIPS